MDINAVTFAVATLLAMKAGEGLAGEAGKETWAGMKRLYELVRRKLVDDPQAQTALQGLRARPQDTTQLRSVADVLRARAERDEEFREALEALVRQASEERSSGLIVAQALDHAKQINVVGDIQGDVTL